MAILGVAGSWNYGVKCPPDDFYQFWVVGQALSKSADASIYSPAEQRRIGDRYYKMFKSTTTSDLVLRAAEYRRTLEIYSTPFLYSVFGIISTGIFEVDLSGYRAVLIAAAVLSVTAISRIFGYSLIGTTLSVVFFVTWFGPFLTDLEVANVNSLQLGALALFLVIMARPEKQAAGLLAGLVLGLAVMFKPNLFFVGALLVISWLICRRYETLVFVGLGIVFAAIIAIISSSLFFNSWHCWFEWLRTVQSMPDGIIKREMGNYGLAQVISDLTGVRTSIYLLLLFMSIVALGVWTYWRPETTLVNREHREGKDHLEFTQDALMVSTGCLIYLLSGPLVWIHYYVLAIPMLLFALRSRSETESETNPTPRPYLVGAVLLGLTCHPVATLLGISGGSFFSVVFSVSAIVLFGVALIELYRIGRLQPSVGHSQTENEKP